MLASTQAQRSSPGESIPHGWLTMVYAHLQDSQGLHFIILGFGSSSGAVHSKVQASVPMAFACDYVWLPLRPGAVVAEEIEEVGLG